MTIEFLSKPPYIPLHIKLLEELSLNTANLLLCSGFLSSSTYLFPVESPECRTPSLP